ncbi:UNVERIFIED_CONTAM: hypothetical protein GTU68_000177, partial [Idotea baltica]|nr:hypothetical protein [Idotea baltica]
LEELSPLAYAEDFDNVGLLVGDKNKSITGVLVTLDTLEEVVDEAIANKCNLIVSFHPIIFKGLKKLTGKTYVERVVMKAIKHDIAIYSMHTALDNAWQGVNDMICNQLELTNKKILIPQKNTNQHIGMGMVGNLDTALSETEFLNVLKSKMNTSCIRHSSLLNKPIKRIAVLGGSGSFAIPAAKASGADILVTSDLKYHDFFSAENNIILADIGHYESEQFTKNGLVAHLTKKITNFAVVLSKINTNPVKYF